MKILVVEDSPQVAETIMDYLALAGHRVDCAYHGQAALQLLAQERFDVIIMDDYLVKPFAMEELEVRLEALSLRGPRGDMGVLGFGDLTVDPASGRATRAGVELKLGKIPFQILTLLVKRAPQLVTRQEVLDTVWGDEEPDSDALRSHIYALRSALDKPFPTPMLETLHGQGYRLVTP